MLKRIKYFFSTEAGLQVRMTLWVSMAVLVVATIVMTAALMVLRQRFATELQTKLSDDINATTNILDQRLKRVEYVTKTTAALVGDNMGIADDARLTSWMRTLMNRIECIDVASVILNNPSGNTVTLYTSYNHETNGRRTIVTLPPTQEYFNYDMNWIASFKEGREAWTTHFTPKDFPGIQLQSFSVPIYAPDSSRVGIVCVMVEEKWLVKMIRQYKTRQDIDLTIYDKLGNCIVAPSDSIRQLPPTDLLTEERLVDRFKWRIVFSADRHIISNQLQPVVLQMIVSIILLLIGIAIAIVIAVKYVARPFVLKQEKALKDKASLERELQIAADTQHQLVPHHFPPFPDRPEISIHAALHPAREVGGDLYDYFIHDGRLFFCLGDVSGKGAPASLFMAATHYLFRSVAAAMPMSDAVRQINISLSTDNEQCNFVTFFFAILDLKTGVLEFCNAGHNPPILIHNGVPRYFAPSESTPLGVWEEAEYPTDSIRLCQEDVLFLYTDGVTEAMNANGEEYGEERTLKCIADCTPKEPQAIIDHILCQVRRHAADTPQSDDITMLCIKKNHA